MLSMNNKSSDFNPMRQIELLDNYKMQMLQKISPEEFQDEDTDVDMRSENLPIKDDPAMHFLAADDMIDDNRIHKR
jgi:hypothetical protein